VTQPTLANSKSLHDPLNHIRLKITPIRADKKLGVYILVDVALGLQMGSSKNSCGVEHGTPHLQSLNP
jgi:hypothetical protein